MSEWKGSLGVDIRKFVDSADYQGPTKQGVRIHGNALRKLVETLQIIAEKPDVLTQEIQLAKIAKNFDSDIVVQVVEYQGVKRLDVREQVNTKKGVIFTTKGISIPIDFAGSFLEGLHEALWCYESIKDQENN